MEASSGEDVALSVNKPTFSICQLRVDGGVLEEEVNSIKRN